MVVCLWGLYSSSIYRREGEEAAALGFPLGVGRTRARRSPIHFLLGSGFILGRSPIPSYLHLFSSWAYGPLWGRFPSPLGAGAPPLGPMWPPGWVGPTRWTPGTHLSLPVHYRKYPKLFRNPNTTFLYINLYLRTIPELLVTSGVSSRIPNNLRSPTHISQYYRNVTER